MLDLRRFDALAAGYSNQADFALIYIEEAHPADGWATGGANSLINIHRNLADRVAAAGQLAEASPCPVYVDQMDDAANRAYGALFERLYVIVDGVVRYQGGRGPMDYKVDELQSWLLANLGAPVEGTN
eukprot:m.31393 g.31393  ORF g.31393 m.31393 type:complete len:128 (-) comp4877_c1_seq1:126-509(-)